MVSADSSVPISPVMEQLRRVLQDFPFIDQAVLFGSLARGTERRDSDLDVAVRGARALSTRQRRDITSALALHFNRPVDLVDLVTVGQPLLDQIVDTGVQVIGTPHQWGDLVYRNIMDHEDFVPYQKRILGGRRKAWINS
jgi:predicted nucleotidyltransferase